MPGEYLTMAEIETRHPNEWVLIDRPKTTAYHEVLGGYLVYHSRDRDEFDRGMADHPEVTDGAVIYTGTYDPYATYLFNPASGVASRRPLTPSPLVGEGWGGG